MSEPGSVHSDSSATRWRPPIPTEHGAWVMLSAAVATPLAVAVVRYPPDGRGIIAFLALILLAVTALCLREAIRRHRQRTAGGRQQHLRRFVFGESVLIVFLAVTLGYVAGWTWLATILVIPAILADIRLRDGGWPLPMGAELSGVVALSMAVPTGAVLLGMTGIMTPTTLWGLFLAFHVGSVIRVRVALSKPGAENSLKTFSMGYHGLVFILVLGMWAAGPIGWTAPVVFTVATIRAFIAGPGSGSSLKALGRAEGSLSALFVILVPWMLG